MVQGVHRSRCSGRKFIFIFLILNSTPTVAKNDLPASRAVRVTPRFVVAVGTVDGGRQKRALRVPPRTVVSKHRLFPGTEDTDGEAPSEEEEHPVCTSRVRDEMTSSRRRRSSCRRQGHGRVHDGEARTELIAETSRTTAAAVFTLPLRRHPMFADDVNAPSRSLTLSRSFPSGTR